MSQWCKYYFKEEDLYEGEIIGKEYIITQKSLNDPGATEHSNKLY